MLEFKSKVKNSETLDLVEKNLQFEAMITKLESDARSNIAKHYQLRLEIESQKNIIDDLNSAITKEKSQNKELKQKLAHQEKTLDQYKKKSRNSSVAKKNHFFLDLEQIANQNSKNSTSNTKIFTEKARIAPNTISISKNIFGSSKTFKTRIGHTRCKSDLMKSLKIVIPQ